MRNRVYIKNMMLISLGAVIITLCAWITLPFAVPFTMQTFGVFAVLFLLGGKRGTLSIVLYIALGALGLPVFSGFNGGFGALLGPTGGFILGFAASAMLFRALGRFSKSRKLMVFIAGISLVPCYAVGVLWYMHYSSTGFLSAVAMCVLPYILPDVLKLCLAFAVASRVSKAVRL